jgi:hypothetical protein
MLVRLYVLLAQSMDRCLSEAARISYPEHELQSHLASTRAAALDMLSANHVVKNKIEQECRRVLALVASCLTSGPGNTAALDDLKAERAVVKNKIAALSNVLAVFRSV